MHLGAFISDCLGGYRERETPGSIPNPEAKPPIADNTASFRCGNVGRRLVHRIFNYNKIAFSFFLFNQLTLLLLNAISIIILVWRFMLFNQLLFMSFLYSFLT